MEQSQEEGQVSETITLEKAVSQVLQNAEKGMIAQRLSFMLGRPGASPSPSTNLLSEVTEGVKQTLGLLEEKLKAVSPDGLGETDIPILTQLTPEGRTPVISALRSGTLIVTDRSINTSYEPSQIPGLFLVEETIREDYYQSSKPIQFLRGITKIPPSVATMLGQK